MPAYSRIGANLMEQYFQPIDASLVPRFSGISTFMRLPLVSTPEEVDVAFVGIPFDGGTTNRAGARHGPREIRSQSSLIRRVHHTTLVSPYDLVRVGDLGDVPVNPISILETLSNIEIFFDRIRKARTLPISAGGDHLITLPILRGLAKKDALGLIHFDAHSDTNDTYFGDNPYTHGSPFRRAVEEGLLDPKRCIQIGIRGAIYHASDYDFAKAVGIRIVFMEELSARGVEDVLAEAKTIVADSPTYVSFDIDSIDPSMAPGTGTPEIGGLTSLQAQQLIRGLRGLNIVGGDVVEVSPPFDLGNITSVAGATIMFELLCTVAERTATWRGNALGV